MASPALGWEQPSYREVMTMWRERSNADWGHPLVGSARHWSDCPAIDTSSIAGISGLRCNQATCALVCLPGHVSKGRRRVRCRKNKKKGTWFWKSTLGSCKTCSVETPTALDTNVTTTCKVNESKIWALIRVITLLIRHKPQVLQTLMPCWSHHCRFEGVLCQNFVQVPTRKWRLWMVHQVS